MPSAVQGLKPHAEDPEFRKKWASIKYHNKERLAGKIKEWTGITVPVGSLYDIHIKRIHEYKRQYMNMVSIIYRYKQIKVRDAPHTVTCPVQLSWNRSRTQACSQQDSSPGSGRSGGRQL